ncbi:MAG: endonuclease/exonuclease/phosphatase family protein [Muribaculaceae bacterium]
MKRKIEKNNILGIFKIIGIALNIVLSLIVIISAYSGYVNPLQDSKFAVLGMCFPILLIIVITLLIIWLCLRQWKIAITSFISLIICAGPILTISPLNFFSHTINEKEKENAFRLLTYNIMNFDDFEVGKSDENNRTIQYIFDTDADFVCLQECFDLAPSKDYKVTAPQLKNLFSKYKYHVVGGRDVAFLSKTPIDTLNIKAPQVEGCGVAAYRVTVNEKPITIVNVHLESIGLTLNDKELYMNITKIGTEDIDIDDAKSKIKRVRYELLSKLAMAFRQRSRQAQAIRRFLNKIDGTVILCGDFNDTPDSYSYRTIKGNMNDAYVECGFGPTITYHDNRFYFKIDHVFYQGNIEATNIIRGNISSSDHYPLLTTFVLK